MLRIVNVCLDILEILSVTAQCYVRKETTSTSSLIDLVILDKLNSNIFQHSCLQLHQYLLKTRHLAFHHHVAPMLFVVNKMEPAHVGASKIIQAILMKVAVLNVSSAPIVHQIVPVFKANAKTRAQGLVVRMQIVK